MIKSVTVTNHLGESLEMVLAEPELSGLAITNITGLGEPEASINITEMAGSDYSAFNSSRLIKRNIVIDIKYQGIDIEDSRLKSYKYFPTKKPVTLRFKTDHRDLECSGYVEKLTPNIFQKEASCQVSIICPNPFFYDIEPLIGQFSALRPLFHFPFSDSEENEIQFGEYNKQVETNIYYEGECETGITILIDVKGACNSIRFYNMTTKENLYINESFVNGDRITINTQAGEKSVTLLRSGNTTSLINKITINNAWIKLIPGDNLFTYTSSNNPALIITIVSKVLFGGI